VDSESGIAVVAMMQVLPFGYPVSAALMETLEAPIYGALH
jgi:hypothetical protein